MAFQVGQPVNPALGRTDYTPFSSGAIVGAQLRGAGSAAIGQGLGNLIGGVGQFIGKRQEAKKQEQDLLKQASGSGKALQSLTQSLSELGVIPEGLGEQVRAAQENMSPREFLAFSQQISGQLKDLIGAGVDSMANAQQQQRAQQEAAVEQLANALALGQPMPQGVPQAIANAAMVAAADIRRRNTQTVRTTDEQGRPIQRTIGMGGETIAEGPMAQQPSVPDPIVSQVQGQLSTQLNDLVMPAIRSLEAYMAMPEINDENIVSGLLARPEMFVKRALAAFGGKEEDVENTQVLQALIAVPVAQIIRNFGAGTGLSDADREFALRAAGGDISMTPEAIARIIQIGQLAAQNIIGEYNERLDRVFPEGAEDGRLRFARESLMLPPAMRAIRPAERGAQTTLGEPVPAGVDPAIWYDLTPEQRAEWLNL